MFYRYRRKHEIRRFDRQIAGILDTAPLVLRDAPWCIASMVANRDVPMYLLAIKAFYPKLGGGKVVAIIDRAMPQSMRDTLSRHLVGIEFAILEDIPTDPCQRGGTWERLLYCLDRSETEYTIQIDGDTLAVGDNLDEVVQCLRENRSFTMSDGFARLPLPEAAAQAQATPGDYIGLVTERCFDRYPDAANQWYVRGSSGFAGFAKGGYSRAQISYFHQEMEALVGKQRWREWGTEQCGSNFAVSNSPDPVVLPHPEYASFNRHVWRSRAKLFHFIGRFRFMDGYFAARGQEVIAALQPGAAPALRQKPEDTRRLVAAPTSLVRSLTPGSAAAYLRWRLGGRTGALQLQPRVRHEFQWHQAFSPVLQIPPGIPGALDAVRDIFAGNLLIPPAWIPQERVLLVADVGARTGTASPWWLATYRRAAVVAFAPGTAEAELLRTNLAGNGVAARAEVVDAELGSAEGRARVIAQLAGRPIDILRLGPDAQALLSDAGFVTLDLHAIVLDGAGASAAGQLGALGYATYDVPETGALWGYRRPPASGHGSMPEA